MSLFNLVKEDYAVRLAAHLFGELTALVIADIARRRADKLGNGMLLHKLGHIKPYHCTLITEKRCGKRLAKLGFTYARRTEEDERTCRSVRIFKSYPASADRLGNGGNRLILTDYPPVKLLLHMDQPLAFLLGKLNNGNVRPFGHNRRYFIGSYNSVRFGVLLLPALFSVGKMGFDLLFLVTQSRRTFKILAVDGGSLFLVYTLDLILKLTDILGRCVGTQTHLGRRLIYQVYRLVRQKSVADVS